MDENQLIDLAKRIILGKTIPKRIVLFGSRARGDAAIDSDFDIFVLVPDTVSARDADIAIRRGLISPDASFDILVCTESEFVRAKNEGWSFVRGIERDGKTIYAA